MDCERFKKKLNCFGLKYHCNICGSWVSDMKPGGGKFEFFRKNEVIGAGYREHVVCPVCGSTDRNRFVDFCIRKYTSIYNDRCYVLHFAPEYELSKKIRRNTKCSYISGDILKGRADRIVDIENICFEDNSFDYVICNYVLQYVDDEKAIKEMMRVLKPNGKMILSVPIGVCFDRTIDFVNGKRIGQSLHKRIYGMDARKRFEKLSGGRCVKKVQCDVKRLNIYGLLNKDTVFIVGEE